MAIAVNGITICLSALATTGHYPTTHASFTAVNTMKLAFRLLQLMIVLLVFAAAGPASAATTIMWWHAMTGELRKQIEKPAADFNASQSEFKVVPSYKGDYTETVTA